MTHPHHPAAVAAAEKIDGLARVAAKNISTALEDETMGMSENQIHRYILDYMEKPMVAAIIAALSAPSPSTADALHSALLTCVAALRADCSRGVRDAIAEADEALDLYRREKSAPSPVGLRAYPHLEALADGRIESRIRSDDYIMLRREAEAASSELTALREQVRALEEDKARLDWLLEHGVQTQHYYSDHRSGGGYVQYHRTRAAIDAARAARPASGGEGEP